MVCMCTYIISTDASAVMEASIGIRVVRGPDWSWGNQDGGDGYVGTLIDLKMNPPSAGKSAGHTVVVAWDNGVTSNYRVGYDDKYDLRAFDSGPSGMSARTHTHTYTHTHTHTHTKTEKILLSV